MWAILYFPNYHNRGYSTDRQACDTKTSTPRNPRSLSLTLILNLDPRGSPRIEDILQGGASLRDTVYKDSMFLEAEASP